MADPTKTRRLEARIHETIALVLGKEVKDPRVRDVTVTGVRLTGDWRDATVFYTVLGGEAEADAAAAGLAGASGTMRSTVGRVLGIRHTPSLTFVSDPLPDAVDRIDSLLAEVAVADAELARQSEGAQYAGDPDPYRRPSEDTGDSGDSAPGDSGRASGGR
jgi:ribosome-binding factor A